ncbi:MAG: hypothetical protein Q8O71_03965 [bacterium]|nr:hypothetical protein [bacterium]
MSWHHLIENFNTSPQEFYDLLEKAIARRQIPNLEISRVEWKEGGLLSSNREYLRLSRERLIGYICAAPFGTGFFFSSRLGDISSRLTPLQMLVLLVIVVLFFNVFISSLGFFWGSVVLAGVIGSLVWFSRSMASKGLTDFDAIVLKILLLGAVYYYFFRPVTFFRYDAINSYADAVHSAVLEVIDEVTKAKGIRLTEDQRKPIMKSLWK